MGMILIHRLDAFLQELKRREEDGIHGARPTHRHAQAAVHVALEEGDLDRLDLLTLGVHERVALVDGFCRVDGVCRGRRERELS